MRFGVPEWGNPSSDHNTPSLPAHAHDDDSQDDKDHVRRVINALENGNQDDKDRVRREIDARNDNSQDDKGHVRRVINACADINQDHNDLVRRMNYSHATTLPRGGFGAYAASRPPAPSPLRPRDYSWSGYSGHAPAPFGSPAPGLPSAAPRPVATGWGSCAIGNARPPGRPNAGAFGANHDDDRRHPPHRQPDNSEGRHNARQPANLGNFQLGAVTPADNGPPHHPMFAVNPPSADAPPRRVGPGAPWQRGPFEMPMAHRQAPPAPVVQAGESTRSRLRVEPGIGEANRQGGGHDAGGRRDAPPARVNGSGKGSGARRGEGSVRPRYMPYREWYAHHGSGPSSLLGTPRAIVANPVSPANWPRFEEVPEQPAEGYLRYIERVYPAWFVPDTDFADEFLYDAAKAGQPKRADGMPDKVREAIYRNLQPKLNDNRITKRQFAASASVLWMTHPLGTGRAVSTTQFQAAQLPNGLRACHTDYQKRLAYEVAKRICPEDVVERRSLCGSCKIKGFSCCFVLSSLHAEKCLASLVSQRG
ncbi:uncharacterized protein LOC62_01G000879 [Vanrija pseudolonga]|uniref:Uncharacterized protein n=1 Tax=Vanrija pseudolonga TaxID=143232 RepID=A0AAF1BEZ1_9TREE|nr:hypothetical protein LOC62_01G000879 [Vanrija pseudolonga]